MINIIINITSTLCCKRLLTAIQKFKVCGSLFQGVVKIRNFAQTKPDHYAHGNHGMMIRIGCCDIVVCDSLNLDKGMLRTVE